MGILVIPVVILVAITVFDLARRPMFRRIALRNLVRRKGEAVLVVAGSLLGTAIITSSFVVGDTFEASIRDIARTHLGPVDETVRVSGTEQLPDIQARLEAPLDGVDGVLPLVSTGATVATMQSANAGPRLAEPRAQLLEVDFAAASRFGNEPHTTGFAGAPDTPVQGEAVIGEDLARLLDVGEGDGLEIFAYGQTLNVTVTGTVPRLGIAGFDTGPGSMSENLFVAPGTIAALAGADTTGAARPSSYVLVSNDGGVFDGVNGTDAVEQRLRERLAGVPGVEIDPSKEDLLDEAAAEGRSLAQLFSTIGGFSVMAGILLLVNIFVMLSEERKPELGIMRAVGMKRNHLVRSFGMEGGAYAVAAAIAGALVGIGVGRVIMWVTAGIFNATDEERFRLDLVFAAKAESVTVALFIGLAISLLTVWGASFRIGRLNVIRAIRDLPDPEHQGRHLRTVIFATLGVLLGGVLFASGVPARAEVPVMAGPALSLFSSVALLRRVLPRRFAISVPCLLALGWGAFGIVLVPEAFREAEVTVFIVQGAVTIGAAVALVTANLDLLGRLTDRLSGTGRGLAARLGVAYPLAKRLRTGLLLGMYAIVIFTLTLLATFSNIFEAQAPRLTAESSAGYDLLVESNPANPPSVAQLEQQPEVEAAAPLLWGFPKFMAHFIDEPGGWALSAFDDRFLARGGPGLSSRDRAYGSDLDAWKAVLADPSLAMVPSFFLQEEQGPPRGQLRVGETFTVINPLTSEERVLRVAGVVDSDWIFSGAMVSTKLADGFLKDVVAPQRHFVAIKEGVDPQTAAQALTARLLANGVDADSFRTLVDRGLSQQGGFFRLMQGFLSLGLVIGIAGLGVVMVRAVRERRRQIGMLRAMGFASRVVRSAFLLEATFVAVVGVAVGVGLGLVTSWSLLTRSDAFGDQSLPFSVPWFAIVVLTCVPLAASVLAAYAPAAQASRIRPAAALRIAD